MKMRPSDVNSSYRLGIAYLVILIFLLKEYYRIISIKESIKELNLDMAVSSFDDQYIGCSAVMEDEIPRLFKIEYSKNKEFADAWDEATIIWKNEKKGRLAVPTGFKDEYAIALLTYTKSGPVYIDFNKAVREAGESKLTNFSFNALHYYITKAVQLLDAEDTLACHRAFRGIKGIRFKSDTKQPIRFGQFASSSKNYDSAREFGEHTFFDIYTCFGVSIKDFSFYPGEEEVLIPPYETFEVTSFTNNGYRNFITLKSTSLQVSTTVNL